MDCNCNVPHYTTSPFDYEERIEISKISFSVSLENDVTSESEKKDKIISMPRRSDHYGQHEMPSRTIENFGNRKRIMSGNKRFEVHVKNNTLRNMVLGATIIIGSASVAMLAVCLWLIIDRKGWIILTSSCSWYESAVIIAASSCMGIILCLGIGIPIYIKRVKTLGITFVTCLFVIVIANIVAASMSVSCTVKINQREDRLHENALRSLNKYGQINYDYYTKSIDRIQRIFRCCGMDKPADYERILHWQDKLSYPTSCCIEDKEGILCGRNIENIKSKGCWIGYFETFRTYLDICSAFGYISALIYIILGIIIIVDTTTNRYTSLLQDEEVSDRSE